MFLLARLGHGEAVQRGGGAVAAGVRHPACQAFLPAHRLLTWGLTFSVKVR